MTPVYVHPVDPLVKGGGSDIRIERLHAHLSRRLTLEKVQVMARSSATDRLVRAAIGSARGIAPRFSQIAGFPRRDLASRHAILGTHFAVPLVPRRSLERCILDAHNVEHLVIRQLAATHSSPVRRTLYSGTGRWSYLYERRVVRSVVGVWAVSHEDAEAFRAMGATRIAVVPNGVELPETVPPLTEAPSIVFVGSLRGEFNVQGISWFLEHCWRPIREQVPMTTLRLVGRGSERFAAIEGVEAVGWVESLDSAYRRSSLAIVPLQSGSGTRLKIAEALAYGRAVVSTSVGAAGYAANVQSVLAIADSAQAFAESCVRLLRSRDEREHAGRSGRVLAEAELSWSAAADTAAASLHEWWNL